MSTVLSCVETERAERVLASLPYSAHIPTPLRPDPDLRATVNDLLSWLEEWGATVRRHREHAGGGPLR